MIRPMTHLTADAIPVSRAARNGRILVNLIVIAIGLALMFAPFLFPDVRASQVAARICVFISSSL